MHAVLDLVSSSDEDHTGEHKDQAPPHHGGPRGGDVLSLVSSSDEDRDEKE